MPGFTVGITSHKAMHYEEMLNLAAVLFVAAQSGQSARPGRFWIRAGLS